MPLDKSDILYLEINGEIVEGVKVFNQADVERIVVGLKKSYHISNSDDYIFFYTRQSLMNEKNIPRDKAIVKHKNINGTI